MADPWTRRSSARRTYRSPVELARDVRRLTRALAASRRERAGARIPAAFRERLMLVVTGVNRCRYCAAFHGQLALRAGISAEASRALLAGVVDDCPDEELPALRYARHWAENDGREDPSLRAELQRTYGRGGAATIEAALHAIRIGNLVGNTWDALICRLSRGRFGCERVAGAVASRPGAR
jgi:AhpD family alkylhydroperoxidase